jgi:FkbM family methyltransferase
MSTVSPAFERRDIDYLLRLIHRQKKVGKKILFVDIGADIGTYAITVGNQFKNYDKLFIIAFEPAKSSYALLEENIKINNLNSKVELYNCALFNENDKEIEFHFDPATPTASWLILSDSDNNNQKVITKTLDSMLREKVGEFDVLILKLDVEGVETEVLQGGENILNYDKEVYLLVEDFVDPSVIQYLQKIGAEFICKLTPYNSWWHLH